MSQFLHDDVPKAIAKPRVFSENSRDKNADCQHFDSFHDALDCLKFRFVNLVLEVNSILMAKITSWQSWSIYVFPAKTFCLNYISNLAVSA